MSYTPADHLSTLGFSTQCNVLAWDTRSGNGAPFLAAVHERADSPGYWYELFGAPYGIRTDFLTEWPPHWGWRPLNHADCVQHDPGTKDDDA